MNIERGAERRKYDTSVVMPVYDINFYNFNFTHVKFNLRGA